MSEKTWRVECDEVDVLPGVTGRGDQRFYLDGEQVTKEQFDAAMSAARDE